MFKLIFFGLFGFTNLVFAARQEQELLSPDIKTVMHTNIINPVTPKLMFKDAEKANAWLTDMSNRLAKWLPDEFLRKRYLTIIHYEALRANLDPQLVLSVITVESRFNKYAISTSSARGLMQVMPFWQKLIGTEEQSLFDVQTNLRYGCTILRHYLERENGNLIGALARYNGSYGQLWYPNLVLNAYEKYWKPYPLVTLKNGGLKYIDYTQ